MVAAVAIQQPPAVGAKAGENSYTYPLLVHKAHMDAPVGVTLTNSGQSNVVTVSNVVPGSEAAKAGLQAGATLHSIGGEECTSATIGAVLLKTSNAGFVELVVSSTVPPPAINAGKRAMPPTHRRGDTTTYENEIELLDAAEPSERKFSQQVTQLVNMGFADELANLHVLRATNGNIEKAVEKLLG
jgi:membrane-associated protease RseP (regulator of RpoE activity)